MTYPFEEASTDFGSLGVKCNSNWYTEAILFGEILLGLADVGDRLRVVLVRAVAEVHAGDVHACLDHLLQHLDGTGDRSDRADDAGEPSEQSVRVGVEGAHVVEMALGVQGGEVRLASHLREKPTHEN